MNGLPAYEEKLLEAIRSAEGDAPFADSRFATLAFESHRIQRSRIPVLDAFATHLGRSGPLSSWRDIPAVPSSAFKSYDLSTAPPEAPILFETSGTSISRPGRVRLTNSRLYEASLLRSFERHLLPDGARLPAIVFGPSVEEAPRSSLWFMVDRVVRAYCPAATWIVRGDMPRWHDAETALAEAEASRSPVLLLGTTILLAAYLERTATGGARHRLPAGSRVMDTGGSKGARTGIARGEFTAALADRLGVRADHVVNEYGMAELGSQFYDDALRAAHEGRPARAGKAIPPWVRTRVFDPVTMSEAPQGMTGILVHYDLANLEIPLAIQTEDVGSVRGGRLVVEGRLLGAEARGCSLAFEEFLERERIRAGAVDPGGRGAGRS